MRRFLLLMILATCLPIAMFGQKNSTKKDVPNVIFDCDMGNDVDDIVALDLLLKYHDEGRIRLIGVVSNRDAESSIAYCDLYNTWCGHPEIPLGIVVSGANPVKEEDSYSWKTWTMEKNGRRIFRTTHRDHRLLPNAVDVYRKLLARSKDQSVIVVSTGFCSNIARLMDTSGDDVSPLDGMSLIRKKVRWISQMGGDFQRKDCAEFNIMNDIPAAKKMFENTPVPLYVTDFLLGERVLYPASSVEKDFLWTNHPFAEAYKVYLPMPYDRPSWDPICALHALEPDSDMFSLSERGTVKVTPEGYTHFTKDENGLVQYLICTDEQCRKILSHFIKTVTKRPKYCVVKKQ